MKLALASNVTQTATIAGTSGYDISAYEKAIVIYTKLISSYAEIEGSKFLGNSTTNAMRMH